MKNLVSTLPSVCTKRYLPQLFTVGSSVSCKMTIDSGDYFQFEILHVGSLVTNQLAYVGGYTSRHLGCRILPIRHMDSLWI